MIVHTASSESCFPHPSWKMRGYVACNFLATGMYLLSVSAHLAWRIINDLNGGCFTHTYLITTAEQITYLCFIKGIASLIHLLCMQVQGSICTSICTTRANNYPL